MKYRLSCVIQGWYMVMKCWIDASFFASLYTLTLIISSFTLEAYRRMCRYRCMLISPFYRCVVCWFTSLLPRKVCLPSLIPPTFYLSFHPSPPLNVQLSLVYPIVSYLFHCSTFSHLIVNKEKTALAACNPSFLWFRIWLVSRIKADGGRSVWHYMKTSCVPT